MPSKHRSSDAGRASQSGNQKKPRGHYRGKATSLKTISKPTRAGQLDACAQRQSDGLADSLARTKTAPAKKKRPQCLGAGGWGRSYGRNMSEPPALRLHLLSRTEQVHGPANFAPDSTAVLTR